MSGTHRNGSTKDDQHLPKILELLGADGIVDVYRDMGFKEVSRSGIYARGFALNRNDPDPSVGINLEDGTYTDHRQVQGKKTWNICKAMIEFGGMGNYQSARMELAKRCGYKELTSTEVAGAFKWHPWEDLKERLFLESFTVYKPGVTEESLLANGAEFGTRMKGVGESGFILAVPFADPLGNRAGYVYWYAPTKANPKWSAKAYVEKENNGWLGADGVQNLRTAEVVIKVEGISDMLALWPLMTDHKKYVVISNVGGGSEAPRPELIEMLKNKRVIIPCDSDQAGIDHGAKWGEKIAGYASDVTVLAPFYEMGTKKDTRDWINDGGTLEDLLRIADMTPSLERVVARLPIRKGSLSLNRTIHLVRSHMIESNVPPDLFDRGGAFAYVSGGRICQHHKTTFMATVDKYCDFYVENKDMVKSIPPPKEVADAILDYGAAGFPVLNGIMDTPVLQDDGTIVAADGYDSVGGFLVRPTFEINCGNAPTIGDAHKAMGVLEHMLHEFQFADKASLANAIAMIITAVAFPFFARKGKTPMFGVGAAQKGSGKTYLCQLAAVLGFSSEMAIALGSVRAEDLEKKIITMLKQGHQYLLLDNAPEAKSVSMDAIASMITTNKVMGRGAYERDSEVGTDVLWMVTGNHLQIGEELKRRVILIRMQVNMVDPSERSFDRTDLIGWARENRGLIFESVFTLISAWKHAGSPQGVDGATMSGFEHWSSTISGVLTMADVPGFRGNKAEVDHGSHEDQAWEDLIQAWWDGFGGHAVRVADLFALDGPYDDPDLELPAELAKIGGGHDAAKRKANQMGRVLSTRLKNRSFRVQSTEGVVDVVVTLSNRKKSSRGRYWILQKLDKQPNQNGKPENTPF